MNPPKPSNQELVSYLDALEKGPMHSFWDNAGAVEHCRSWLADNKRDRLASGCRVCNDTGWHHPDLALDLDEMDTCPFCMAGLIADVRIGRRP